MNDPRSRGPGLLAAALLAVLLPAGAAWAQISEAETARAKQVLEKTYGAQIRQAKARPVAESLLPLAQELLKAAGNQNQSPALRAELARQALDLVMPLCTPEATALGEKALGDYVALAQPKPVQKQTLLADLYAAEMKAARGERHKELTVAMSSAVAELARAYENDGDLDNAAVQMSRASGLARGGGFSEQADEYDAQAAGLSRQRFFKRDLAEAKQVLQAAIAGENPPLIKQTHERIAMLHLLKNGDPAAAHDGLVAAGHPWAAMTKTLKTLTAQKAPVKTDDMLAAADMLRKASDQAEIHAKGDLLEKVLEVCQAAEAKVTAGTPEATRMALLRQQATATLEKLPARPKPSIAKLLGPINGLLTAQADGSVQISYSFAVANQMLDWSAINSRWAVENGELAHTGKRFGEVLHTLKFRSDKPIKLSLAVKQSGPTPIMLALNDSLTPDASIYLRLAQSGGQGWELGGLQAKPQTSAAALGTAAVRVDLSYDGAGGFTWTINGQAQPKLQAKQPPKGFFRVTLGAQHNGARYSDVVIRGTPVLPEPEKK